MTRAARGSMSGLLRAATRSWFSLLVRVLLVIATAVGIVLSCSGSPGVASARSELVASSYTYGTSSDAYDAVGRDAGIGDN
jgi:hypothetical protein